LWCFALPPRRRPPWDALLPPEVRRLPDELARIDAYLDDERFITPWQISRTLRRRTGQAPAEIDRLTAQVAAIARRTLAQAEQVARNARRARAKRPDDGRLRRLVERLEETTAATHRLLDQTRQRLAGTRVIPDRLISLADPDARPIRKGKPHKPTEFGYTVLLAECERGFIATHHTHQGNPPDAAQLVPAVEEVIAHRPAA
jgi:transposase, IS5 family